MKTRRWILVSLMSLSGPWALAQQCLDLPNPNEPPWEQRVSGSGRDFSSAARALGIARRELQRELQLCHEICAIAGGTFTKMEGPASTVNNCSGGEGSPYWCDVYGKARCRTSYDQFQ